MRCITIAGIASAMVYDELEESRQAIRRATLLDAVDTKEAILQFNPNSSLPESYKLTISQATTSPVGIWRTGFVVADDNTPNERMPRQEMLSGFRITKIRGFVKSRWPRLLHRKQVSEEEYEQKE